MTELAREQRYTNIASRLRRLVTIQPRFVNIERQLMGEDIRFLSLDIFGSPQEDISITTIITDIADSHSEDIADFTARRTCRTFIVASLG